MKLAPGPDTKSKQPVHEIGQWLLVQTLRANSQFMKLAPGPDTNSKQPVHEIGPWSRH